VKLIRDKIPELVRAREGKPLNTSKAGDDLYRRLLHAKLLEESSEFLAGRQVEELADVLEVVFAIAAMYGWSPERLEEFRRQKAEERGGFEKRIVLHE
jgi:predicted house-cleaning noncanonical NTP pyrophosphatase (MazG superfamily)